MHSTLLSVVTIVLNDPQGLARTGESIISQTLRPEWVVVDGKSANATLDVLRNYGNAVTWVSEKDKGIYDAMNKGVGMCSGDYVVFLNAGDCFSDSEVLADVCSFLSSRHGMSVDVMCCGANLIFPSGSTVYRSPKIVEDYIWHGLPANHQATYYRRISLGINPYDLEFKMCGDYFIAASLYVKNAIFGYFDRPVVNFFLDGVSSNWDIKLFMEPYAIQQNILKIGLFFRLLSILKRFISGIAVRLFGIPFIGTRLLRIFIYARSRS
jgi:putative colanic acid biosynthesis glycosyltransferase